jgi:hypothetical protein
MRKRIFSLTLIVLIFSASLFVLTACGERNESLRFEIEESTYTVGDTFDKNAVRITATLPNGDTRPVAANLIFVKEDLDSLKLVKDKFEVDGEYKVNIWHIEQNELYRDELYLGEWKITVKPKIKK